MSLSLSSASPQCRWMPFTSSISNFLPSNRRITVPNRNFRKLPTKFEKNLYLHNHSRFKAPTSHLGSNSNPNSASKGLLGGDCNAKGIGLGVAAAAAWACLLFVARCKIVAAAESIGDVGSGKLMLERFMPELMQVLCVLKDQGLILAALLGLSAFFSMTETAITTLWPWKVVILLLTEITPKSIAVHNATEVVRFVARTVAWLSILLYPVGRVVTFLSMGMLKLLGVKGSSEPYVTEDELKLMLRGAELSGGNRRRRTGYD